MVSSQAPHPEAERPASRCTDQHTKSHTLRCWHDSMDTAAMSADMRGFNEVDFIPTPISLHLPYALTQGYRLDQMFRTSDLDSRGARLSSWSAGFLILGVRCWEHDLLQMGCVSGHGLRELRDPLHAIVGSTSFARPDQTLGIGTRSLRMKLLKSSIMNNDQNGNEQSLKLDTCSIQHLPAKLLIRCSLKFDDRRPMMKGSPWGAREESTSADRDITSLIGSSLAA